MATEHDEKILDGYRDRIPTTEAERIAITAAKLAVTDVMSEMFVLFGIDRGNAQSIESFREDLAFARTLRKRKDIGKDLDFLASIRDGAVTAGKRAALITLSIVVVAFVMGVGQALRDWAIFALTGKHFK